MELMEHVKPRPTSCDGNDMRTPNTLFKRVMEIGVTINTMVFFEAFIFMKAEQAFRKNVMPFMILGKQAWTIATDTIGTITFVTNKSIKEKIPKTWLFDYRNFRRITVSVRCIIHGKLLNHFIYLWSEERDLNPHSTRYERAALTNYAIFGY